MTEKLYASIQLLELRCGTRPPMPRDVRRCLTPASNFTGGVGFTALALC